MRLSLIDRAIATIAPSRAVSRAMARHRLDMIDKLPSIGALAGGVGADPAIGGGSAPRPPVSNRWWRPLSRDARADTLPQLSLQRGQSRELASTNPIAAGAINTNVDRIVGTGLALSAQPNRDVLGWTSEKTMAWKRITQNEFSLWADSKQCDIEQFHNFYEAQGLVLRSALVSGDCLTNLPDGDRNATMPYALRLQLLEADRCGNPNGTPDTADVVAGVRLGRSGAAEAFHIYAQHPGARFAVGTTGLFEGDWIERVGVTGRLRILHHYRKTRPGMPRGIPYLAPIVDCIKQISRYTEAEIMAAVISAYFTVFIETPTGNAAPVFDGTEPGAGAPGAEIGLGMGAVVGLAPGEKPHTSNPGRPNPNFDPFVQAIIKQMGMALSLPYELLVKQFNASYSASKAALLEAWVYFRNMRNWLALSFCQPVYETWLAEAVAIGRISAPGFFQDPLLRWAYTRAAWPGDSMGSINPKDEIEAYLRAVDGRIMTREHAEWLMWGTDFNQTFDQKADEQARLAAANLLPVAAPGAAPSITPPSPKKDEQ
ncbi:phage portal protein [soil metagenome]